MRGVSEAQMGACNGADYTTVMRSAYCVMRKNFGGFRARNCPVCRQPDSSSPIPDTCTASQAVRPVRRVAAGARLTYTAQMLTDPDHLTFLTRKSALPQLFAASF